MLPGAITISRSPPYIKRSDRLLCKFCNLNRRFCFLELASFHVKERKQKVEKKPRIRSYLQISPTTSRRLAERKVEKFEKNITKRGALAETSTKRGNYPVGPVVLGFFVFVVVGSSLFQIIRTATSGGMA